MKLKLFFVVLAALFLLVSNIITSPTESQLPTSLLATLKILPLLILLYSAYSQTSGKNKVILLIALVFSMTGDVLLAFGSDYFVFGLAAFLLAQLSYAVRFSFDFCWNKERLVWIALLVISMLSVSIFVLPATGDLQLPVGAYMVAIFSMGFTACFRRGSQFMMPAIGAFIFITSDSLIAINKFLIEIPHASILIMVSYYSAQYLITQGLIRSED